MKEILHSGEFLDYNDNVIRVTFYTGKDDPGYELSVDKNDILFPQVVDNIEITVTCIPWTDDISVDAPHWIDVTTVRTGEDSITYKVTCSANDSGYSRSGVINISVEGAHVAVNVYQEGKTYTIYTIPDEIRAGANGGTYILDTWCDGADPFLSDSLDDWWDWQYVGEVSGNRRYNVVVESNSGSARGAVIKVRLDGIPGMSKTVILMQEGTGPEPEPGDVTITPNKLTFDASKSSQYVLVNSSYPVDFELPAENWLSVEEDFSSIVGENVKKYKVTCETNMGSTERRATVKFYATNDASKYVILTIIQNSL